MCGAKIVQSFGVAKFCSVKLPVVAVWGGFLPLGKGHFCAILKKK